MNTSELIKSQHLERKAVIYIRQSIPHQVLTNQESRRFQAALRKRAIGLGWADKNIDTIESDLGLTGTTIEGRKGFEDLVTQITLSQVGLLLCYDVSRLARNCTDWYPLLDICKFRKCLIADRDGIYDPTTMNGRMILGIKGQMAEYELYTIQARLEAGLLSKAKRGELALKLPVGLVRDQLGQVKKDPNVEVQDRIDLIFCTFLKVKSGCQVVKKFHKSGLLIPRQDYSGDVIWKKANTSSIIVILKNPAYAGAFAYGRSCATPTKNSSGNHGRKKLPIEEWKILVKDQYQAYITWEKYEKIQSMIKDNFAEYGRNKTRGVPRKGKALLHGLIYCGKCGYKLTVQYKSYVKYVCMHLKQHYNEPGCQIIPADPIDDYIVKTFFKALSPVELNIYAKAIEEKNKDEEKANKAQLQQIERLRYQVRLAERQYNKTDPDNRLVAGELERRWEVALQELKDTEEELERERKSQNVPLLIEPKIKSAFQNIGKNLPEIWKSNVLSQEQKKTLLRCLIDKIVIHRSKRDYIHTRIVWKGGQTTSFEVPIKVASFAELSTANEMKTTIVSMAKQGKSDDEIAAKLTRDGHRSPKASTVLTSTVSAIRLRHRILMRTNYSNTVKIQGHLTIPQIAEQLGVKTNWIYDRIKRGTIISKKNVEQKRHIFPDNPKTLEMFKNLKERKVKKLDF